jgi:hypothetical protein
MTILLCKGYDNDANYYVHLYSNNTAEICNGEIKAVTIERLSRFHTKYLYRPVPSVMMLTTVYADQKPKIS